MRSIGSHVVQHRLRRHGHQAEAHQGCQRQALSDGKRGPQAAGKKQVLAAYSSFWTEQTKAYAQASVTGTDLKKYANADALSRAEGDIANLKKVRRRR